jgi:hypothetical protein
MKETLVQARMGLDDMRAGLETSKKRLAAEENELETVRRRKKLAEGINDAATVEIATKYEQMHLERVDVVKRKVAAQEGELGLAERDVAQMTAELKAVVSGADPRAASAIDAAAAAEADAAVDSSAATGALRSEIDSLGRARAQAEREADADRRLDELKRRMGK